MATGLADGDRLIVSALDYPVSGMKLALGDELLKGDDIESEEEVAEEKVETQVASNDSDSGE